MSHYASIEFIVSQLLLTTTLGRAFLLRHIFFDWLGNTIMFVDNGKLICTALLSMQYFAQTSHDVLETSLKWKKRILR